MDHATPMPTSTSKRTLLFYVHAMAGGGAERVTARLASGYAARGDRILLVVDHEADEWRTSIGDDVEVVVLPKGHLQSIFELASLLRREKPDFSVSALSATNLKHIIAAVCAGRTRRAVITYHGFAQNEPMRLSRLGFWLTSILSRTAAASVVVSEALKQDLIKRFRAAPERLVTIYNPASPEFAQPPLTAGALAIREPIVIAVGRLVADKGFRFLVRAFARVEYPQARLIILGKGPDLAFLRAEAARLKIAERVEFAGYVSDTNAYLSRARCFVSPSYFESFGLAIVEALDYGIAVVTTDSGGPKEILNSEGLGKIVPVGDEKAMADAITESLSNPGEPAPRQLRAGQFTLDAAMAAYDEVFRKLGALDEGAP
jgi:glycosyltransferase involved in cell wall biosynthesis